MMLQIRILSQKSFLLLEGVLDGKEEESLKIQSKKLKEKVQKVIVSALNVNIGLNIKGEFRVQQLNALNAEVK